jgi:hypothetical protein
LLPSLTQTEAGTCRTGILHKHEKIKCIIKL